MLSDTIAAAVRSRTTIAATTSAPRRTINSSARCTRLPAIELRTFLPPRKSLIRDG
jgi:hypothetical protein